MAINTAKVLAEIETGLTALVSFTAKGKLTQSSEDSINALSETLTELAKDVQRANKHELSDGKVTDASIRRDADLIELAKRSWLVTDGIKKEITRGGIDKDPIEFEKLLQDTNGAYEVKAINDEITGRDKRKTVDTLPSDQDLGKLGYSKGDIAILDDLFKIKKNLGIMD